MLRISSSPSVQMMFERPWILGLLVPAFACQGTPSSGLAGLDDTATTTAGSTISGSDESGGGVASSGAGSGGGQTDSGGPMGDDGSSGGLSTGDAATGDETTGAETGDDNAPGAPFPVDCDAFSVWVEGGGGYSTVFEGVNATPPNGTVYICPGTYMNEHVPIDRSLTVVGAGSELVTVHGWAGSLSPVVQASLPASTSVTIQGMTLVGGVDGIRVTMATNSGATAVLRDVRATGASRHGVSVNDASQQPTGYVEMVDVRIDSVVSEEDGAGLSVRNVPTNLTDCTIEDNYTTGRGGGLLVHSAIVQMQGGAVRRNRADAGGGGAVIRPNYGDARIEITGTDWGTGQDQDNEPNDVSCFQHVSGSTTSHSGDAVSWLGLQSSATCTYTTQPASANMPCCVPS